MATSILRAPPLLSSPPKATTTSNSHQWRIQPCFPTNRRINRRLRAAPQLPLRPLLRRFAANSETADTEEVVETVMQESLDEELEDNADKASSADNADEASAILVSLQAYKEAVLNGDQSKIVETEVFLHSIEDEKNSLKAKVAAMAAELSIERDRLLRISADFDNFRKRTERERASLMSNAQAEVVESLLPVLDNFERARDQIKVETEGEEKINNSYQSIYKQFLEILNSLGVEAVETVGKNFDPLLHEAIMREESTEFEEGIIIQEFRKGFKIGERLIRPSMVKVSAGPGPEKSEPEDVPAAVDSTDTSEETDNAGEAD